MATPTPLSRLELFAYGIGGLGWAAASQVVGIQLIYFFIPPAGGGCSDLEGLTTPSNESGSGVEDPEPIFPIYVSQVKFAVVLNVIVILAAAGRLWDAVTDPCVANFSDRLRWKRGRRLPMMAIGGLPTALFAALLFFPIVPSESAANIVWLAIVQLIFYLSLTCYCTPFFALVPEFGHTEKQRLNLSMAGSISFAVGSVLAGAAPSLGEMLGFERAEVSLQVGISIVCLLAAILMYVPVLAIDERKHTYPPSDAESLFTAMRHCAGNRHFRAYVMADLAFFYASAMIQTALPFYLTVLLCEPNMLTPVVGALVLTSLLWYYPVALLARRFGKKRLVLLAMLVLAIVFIAVSFLGQPLLPVPPMVQLFGGLAVISVPLSALGMLPNACLADIVVHDALRTGQSNEGMFFAARTFLQKIGVTLGIMTFASLTNFGNSPGDDLGVRLSGPACVVVLLLAVLAFSFYDEKTLTRETHEMMQAKGRGAPASSPRLNSTAESSTGMELVNRERAQSEGADLPDRAAVYA